MMTFSWPNHLFTFKCNWLINWILHMNHNEPWEIKCNGESHLKWMQKIKKKQKKTRWFHQSYTSAFISINSVHQFTKIPFILWSNERKFWINLASVTRYIKLMVYWCLKMGMYGSHYGKIYIYIYQIFDIVTEQHVQHAIVAIFKLF